MYRILSESSLSLDSLPVNSNLINYSMFKELETDLVFRSFSIKYVIEGLEHYKVDNRPYNVSAGQYLLVNRHRAGTVGIRSKNLVKGLCIDISPAVLQSVLDRQNVGIDADHFCSERFFVNKYRGNDTFTGRFLNRLSHELTMQPETDHRFNNEFFYCLAENVITDQLGVLKDLRSLPARKWETKKEVVKKLYEAKDIMTRESQSLSEINEICLAIGMSEYHFFRSFRAVFGISPYQFLLNTRLNIARESLIQGKSVSETATTCGFNDISSFSRAFKRRYGQPPSSLKNF